MSRKLPPGAHAPNEYEVADARDRMALGYAQEAQAGGDWYPPRRARFVVPLHGGTIACWFIESGDRRTPSGPPDYVVR